MDYSVLNSSSIFAQPVQHIANGLQHNDFDGIASHFSINGNCQIYQPLPSGVNRQTNVRFNLMTAVLFSKVN